MSNETYGDRLNKAMQARGKTRADLARYTDVTVQRIGQVITGSGALDARNHHKAARFLRVRPEWLALGTKPMDDSEPAAMHVPVIGEARMGTDGDYTESQYPEGGDGAVRCGVDSPGAFALRCVGNSMRPRIQPGHYVVIEPNRKPIPPDDIVAVRTSTGRHLIKKYAGLINGFIRLTSFNENFPPEDLQPHEVLEMYRVANIFPPSDFIPRADE